MPAVWQWLRRAARAAVFFAWVGPVARKLAGKRPLRWISEALMWLERSTGRWPVAVLVGVGLVLVTILRQLDTILRAMHPDGGSAYGGQGLVRVLHRPDADYTRDVLETWGALGGALTRSATAVFTEYSVVDTLFAVVYTALLGIFLLKLGRALEETRGHPRLAEVAEQRVEQRAASVEDASFEQEHAELENRLEAYRRLANFAFLALPLLFLVDITENLVAFLLVLGGSGASSFEFLAVALAILAHLKPALIGLILVPTVVATVWLIRLRRPTVGGMVRAFVVLRGQVLLIVLLAGGLLVSDQSADAIRRWRDDVLDGVFAVLLVLLLALLTFVLAGRLLATAGGPRKSAPRPGSLLVAAAAVTALAAVLYLNWHLGSGLWVVAVLLFLTGVLSAAAGSLRSEPEETQPEIHRTVLPGALAATAPLLLGLAVVAAATPAAAYDEPWGRGLVDAVLLGLLGVGLVAASGVLYAARHRLTVLLAGRWFPILALVVALAIALRVYVNPWRTAEVLGSTGVFAGFLLGASFVVFALALAAERFEPPSALVLLQFRRVPYFLLIVVWSLSISFIDRDGVYADARVVPAAPATTQIHRAPPRADSILSAWEGESAGEQGNEQQAVPMLMVAAAGGGIRAAYWTAVVLRCVLEGDGVNPACGEGGPEADARASSSFFVASGISGGSFGLATYAAQRELGDPAERGWAEERLDDDAIAPVIAWGLFTDLPMALLRRDGGSDRAEILERAWEREWVDERSDGSFLDALVSFAPSTDASPFARPYLQRWATPEARFPVLLLNGAKVQDGCRVNVSVVSGAIRNRVAADARERRLAEDCLALRLFEQTAGSESTFTTYVEPGGRGGWSLATSDDLYDLICRDQDVRLSTAALLSARFPWVLPSGRLHCEKERKRPVNVVDGGYFDTSGASPVVELMSALSPHLATRTRCIVPVFLQIDTGYADPRQASDRAPLENTVPATTVRRARDAREHNARQAAALTFSGPFGARRRAFQGNSSVEVDRVAHVYPRAHPGARAPLGWTLSGTAMRELRSQLMFNTGEIEKVRSWFSGQLTCRTPS